MAPAWACDQSTLAEKCARGCSGLRMEWFFNPCTRQNSNLTKRRRIRTVRDQSELHNMRSSHTSFSPLLRSLAAGALLVWVVAQALCFAHCNFGVGHGDSEEASCHGSASTSAHHDDGDTSGPVHPDSSGSDVCFTLKSALVGSSAADLVQPGSQLLYTLAPFAPSLDVRAVESITRFSRQARSRDWLLTPEVCLGPAHRSLAPPSLS